MASPTTEEIRASSYVGFDSITAQIEHKLLKRGFQFNVIVVGACVGVFLALWEVWFMWNVHVWQARLGWASLR